MSTLYDGRACQDPAHLARVCRERQLPDQWFAGPESPNSFRVPLGRGPGEGKILLTLGDLNAIDKTADHDLTFLDDAGNQRTLKKVTLLRGVCLTPGWKDDPRAVFLCPVVDRRWQLAQLAPVNKAYNVSSADGTTYLTNSLNSGVAWTWQQIADDLWNSLGLGASAPTLPYTYTLGPENLLFVGVGAWEAVNQLLDALGCTIKYDPVADSFAFLKLGDTTATAATATAAELAKLNRDADKTWDSYWQEPDRGRLTEKVRVMFPRRPQPQDGTSPLYAVDVTLTPAVAGVVAGSVTTLRDGLTAVGSGTPTNASDLSTRAGEVAARWRAKRVNAEARQTLVYRDFQDGPKLLCETTGAVAFDDRGGMMGTEVASRPDGLMEKFRPYEQPFILDPWAVKGKLDGTLSTGGSATLSVWRHNGTAEADSGENVTVFDWGALPANTTLAAGTEVEAVRVPGSAGLDALWYLVPPPIPQVDKGILSATLNYGSSATVRLWHASGGVETDTGIDVTAYDWLLASGQTVASASKVVLMYINGRWYVVGAVCP